MWCVLPEFHVPQDARHLFSSPTSGMSAQHWHVSLPSRRVRLNSIHGGLKSTNDFPSVSDHGNGNDIVSHTENRPDLVTVAFPLAFHADPRPLTSCLSDFKRGGKLPQRVPSKLSATVPHARLCGFDAPAAFLPITPHSAAEATAWTLQYLPDSLGHFRALLLRLKRPGRKQGCDILGHQAPNGKV